MPDRKHFLPITKKELDYLGWDYVDVIIVNGDAYVDHPSFGAAVIGRVLEREGLRVAILPQPNWQDDLRDFKKLGTPRLFFGVTSGNMDSMVNHYTANKRLRSDDAYTAGGKSGFRPDYATTVYSRILKSPTTTTGATPSNPPSSSTARPMCWSMAWANGRLCSWHG